MKIHGETIKGSYVEDVIIPRPPKRVPKMNGDGQPEKDFNGNVIMEEKPVFHAFKLQAVLDYSDFEKMCPQPEPPPMMLKGGIQTKNTESPQYKEAITKWSILRFDWAVLKSLAATPGLEWEKVDLENPETWHLYREELKDAGFSANEIGRILTGFQIANCLDERKLEEARKAFLQRPQAV